MPGLEIIAEMAKEANSNLDYFEKGSYIALAAYALACCLYYSIKRRMSEAGEREERSKLSF